MRPRFLSALATAAVLGSLFVSAPMAGQAIGVEVPRSALPVFQGPPGARALGIGGAFIAVADDATAAEANPAGLTILSRPEVSLHVRNHNLELAPESVCIGDCGSESRTRPSFASYVQPFNRGAFSIFYSSTFDFRPGSTFNRQNAPDLFVGLEDFDSISLVGGGPIKLRRYGIAGAFRPTPMVSLGAAVAMSRLELNDIETLNISFTDPDTGKLISGALRTRFESKQTKASFNAGLLLNPGGRFSGGLVYKREGRYTAKFFNEIRACLCTPAEAEGLPFELNQFSEVPQGTTDLSVPDLYGAGVAFRPMQRTLIAADYTLQRSKAEFTGKTQEVRGIRLGAEYLMAMPNSNVIIPLRVGYSKDHDANFEVSDNFEEDVHTFTVGTGVVVGNNEFDVAYSNGKTLSTGGKLRVVILSGIHRF